MALGLRKHERQQNFWVATEQLPHSEGHVFYNKLNKLLAEADFDKFVESLSQESYHKNMGRPGIPPGTYFRMLLVGYFEGIGSERGIAWRCADSLSLCEFLGIPLAEDTPDHSSLTRVRDRQESEDVRCSPSGANELSEVSRTCLKPAAVARLGCAASRKFASGT